MEKKEQTKINLHALPLQLLPQILDPLPSSFFSKLFDQFRVVS
jgi:hypothetical protein